MAYSVFDISDKILSKGASSEGGELISNLKLQKLLYYVQGFNIAFFGKPLFDAEIEAWQYGPVVPEVYHKYKGYGYSGLSPSKSTLLKLTPEEEDLFDQVYKVYGDFSAIGLMNLTHNESPWCNTEIGDVISKDKLKEYFLTRLNNG